MVSNAFIHALVLLPTLSLAFLPSMPSSRHASPLMRRGRDLAMVGEGSTYVAELQTLDSEDYIAVGLAQCFSLNSDNKLDPCFVLEPLTAGTLETLAFGVPTSYKRVLALTCGQLFIGDSRNPQGINMEALRPLLKGEAASECSDMVIRSLAAARTFKRRVEAQIVAVGEIADDFNFNTDKKRVLNQKFEPSFDDNVKQHSSIDVYGRASEDELSSQIDKLANA